MRSLRMTIFALAISAVLAVVLPASASAVIHSPAEGATYQLADTILFDWAWAPDEYATAWIGFARSPDGPWSPYPEKRFTDGGYPFLSSHVSITAYAIGAGTWWWRLCNHSINIEDDKCQYSADPARQLTIVPATSSLRITAYPPASTTSTSATFTFDDASRPGAMFDYRLDIYPQSWMLLFLTGPDRGSASFSNLRVGRHTFWLVAKDILGNISAPVNYTWTVTAPPPPPRPPVPATPRITSHPPKRTHSRTATFRFADSTMGVTFHYRLDGGTFRFGDPARYARLAYKRHTLRVWATKSGRSSNTVTFTWTVLRRHRHST